MTLTRIVAIVFLLLWIVAARLHWLKGDNGFECIGMGFVEAVGTILILGALTAALCAIWIG